MKIPVLRMLFMNSVATILMITYYVPCVCSLQVLHDMTTLAHDTCKNQTYVR